MKPLMTAIDKMAQKQLGRTPGRVLLYNNYDLTEGSILLFLFDLNSNTPFAVLKLSRSRSILAREYENLRAIHKICPRLAAAPLFFDGTGEFHVLCTEPLDANRLSGYGAQTRKLKLISTQLATLHELLRSQSSTTIFSAEDYLRPFSGLYDSELPVNIADYYNETASEHARTIEEFAVAQIPQHGDLYFDNILTKGRRVYFLDWEDFGEVKLPGFDLFSLVFDVFRLQDKNVSVMEKAIDFVADSTVEYFRKLGIPADTVYALMSYTLVQQYYRSWTLGRTSKGAFAHRLVFLAENEDLLARMANAYSVRW